MPPITLPSIPPLGPKPPKTADPEITRFALEPGSEPWSIARGPSEDLWFTVEKRDVIGRITPDGGITEYPTAAGAFPHTITLGPDGAMWFTEYGTNAIGRITEDGELTEHPLPDGRGKPWFIASGRDGLIWFTLLAQDNAIGSMTLDGDVTIFPADTSTYRLPGDIVPAPGGGVFMVDAHAFLVHVDSDGTYTDYPLPGGWVSQAGLGLGPDGAVWIPVRRGVDTYGIARVEVDPVTGTPAMSTFTIAVPNRVSNGIVAAHGEMWFSADLEVAHTAPTGLGRTEFYGLGGTFAHELAPGVDGTVWFVLPYAGAIARLEPAAPRGIVH